EALACVETRTPLLRRLLDPGLLRRQDFLEILRAFEEERALFRGLIAERRRRPGDDLVSRLIGLVAGEPDFGDDEIAFICMMIFIAGHETSYTLIGNGLKALLDHPDEAELLRRRPDLAGAAVTEILRYDGPLQSTTRRATEDFALGDTRIRAGDQVLLCLGAANRDPARFEEPDAFRILRDDNAHVGFGYGLHACLGGALAAGEAETFFGRLARRPERLAPAGAPVWQTHSAIVHGMTRLPLRVTRPAA
ncbi:MAG TPA: cytochrome P450, partial [Methylomirabilota bacterium]|nr:cytochrome P450 [Methylomirabilota bacterium]